jgi:hypothetical protein
VAVAAPVAQVVVAAVVAGAQSDAPGFQVVHETALSTRHQKPGVEQH